MNLIFFSRKSFLGILFLTSFFAFLSSSVARASNDVVALRVISNPAHLSAMEWYKDQNFTGSPSAILVDGYDGVMDGTTAYVNFGDVNKAVIGKKYFESGDTITTKIMVIALNVNADSNSAEIFNQILKKFKFNTNIEDAKGECTGLSNILGSIDCPEGASCMNFDGNDTVTGAVASVAYGAVKPVANMTGNPGQALYFNGSNPLTVAASSLSYTNTNGFLINFDVYPTATGTLDNVSSKILNGLLIDNKGFLRIITDTSAVGNKTGYLLPLNRWTNIGLALSAGDTGNRILKLYINGALERSLFFGASSLLTDSSWTGGKVFVGSPDFKGGIDNLRIFIESKNEKCDIDSVCLGQGYCQGGKASIARDVRRAGDKHLLEAALQNYKDSTGATTVDLSKGTYVAGQSLSTWPSWQSTLSKILGVTLPVDPINLLGPCGGNPSINYNPKTCWDEVGKSFSIPGGIPGSLVYGFTISPSPAFSFKFENLGTPIP